MECWYQDLVVKSDSGIYILPIEVTAMITHFKYLQKEVRKIDNGSETVLLAFILTSIARQFIPYIVFGILKKIVERFKRAVTMQLVRQEALVNYEIDEYDERFLRHLALGYTKEQITNLRGMPFGVKSLEKRQNELVHKLFPEGESVNATRLVVRALELRILDLDNLEPDAE